MGNCQAAEAATVVIQHPGGKVERAYWSLTANQVMASNPGHYVAAVIVTTTAPLCVTEAASSRRSHRGGDGAAQLKHLKLLRPDDTLLIGRVYRLISFEEVLREFASKKHVKLSRLLIKQKEKGSPTNESSSGGGAASSAAAAQGEQGVVGGGVINDAASETSTPMSESQEEIKAVDRERLEDAENAMPSLRTKAPRHGQWRPTLQSIAEVGSPR